MKPSLKVVAANDNVVSVAPARRVNVRRILRTSGELAATTAKGTLKAMRYALFYVLMWLRILVHFVATACAAVGLLAFVMAAILKPDWGLHSYMWKIAGFSFSGFLVGWLYDGLLLLISPEPLIIDGRVNH